MLPKYDTENKLQLCCIESTPFCSEKTWVLKCLDSKTGVPGVNKTFEHPVIPVSTFLSQQNITAFNKETEQCVSLSTSFKLFQIVWSITVCRLMPSAELNLGLR
jgi:hypothetical protein